MKFLILRTIAHSKIWEQGNETCHYDTLSYDIINKWEPDLIHKSLNDVSYGLGIYAEQYFRPDYKGKIAFSNTAGEEKISLLRLQPILDGSPYFGKDEGNNIIIKYSYESKINNSDRMTMFNIDKKLRDKKLASINKTYSFTKYPSLCFTLEDSLVENVLNEFGITL